MTWAPVLTDSVQSSLFGWTMSERETTVKSCNMDSSTGEHPAHDLHADTDCTGDLHVSALTDGTGSGHEGEIASGPGGSRNGDPTRDTDPADGRDLAGGRDIAGGGEVAGGADSRSGSAAGVDGTDRSSATDRASGIDPGQPNDAAEVEDPDVGRDCPDAPDWTCGPDPRPYSACGVQYLPRRYYEKGEKFKRTMQRMSLTRCSRSDGNLKSRLYARTRTPTLDDGRVRSLPEMAQLTATAAQRSEADCRRQTEIADGKGRPSPGSSPEVEFSISIGDGDASPISTDSNKNELKYVDKPSRCRYPFENIVLSGGGSKGYAYIGALKALEDSGILSQIRRVGGSSAGAICGGLVAVGCSPQEIADTFFCDIKWLFQDQKCACCFCLPKIWKNYGINPGLRFLQIYGKHIAKKVKNPDITFMELYQEYGREFCVVVTNLTRMCSEYCHWTTTPDLPIRQAVRISMSFPVMYEPVKCNLFGEEHLYMDGGTLDQYPIHCFDGPLFELNHNLKTGQKRSLNNKTLGLYVMAEEAIDYKIWSTFFGQELPYSPPYLPNTKLARRRLKEELKRRRRADKSFDPKKYISELKNDPVLVNDEPLMRHYTLKNKLEMDITSFGLYCKASLSTVIVNQRRLHVKREDVERTVAINCGYIGTNDYVLEPADREFMIRCGYEHTQQFLKDYLKRLRSDGATCRMDGERDRSSSPDGGTVPRRPTTLGVRMTKETIV